MRPFAFHRLRLAEWLAHRDVTWANRRIRRLLAFRDRRQDDADRHGLAADLVALAHAPRGPPDHTPPADGDDAPAQQQRPEIRDRPDRPTSPATN